jgi:hypothetical protein
VSALPSSRVPVVGFCGSRSLPASAFPFVARVVASVVSRGFRVAVGCAVGADQAVLSARVALPFVPSSSGPALSVFAVGGPSGAGFWRGSALAAVRAAAALAVSPGHGLFSPVSVSWWAGGPASVPLRARLLARSLALVSSLAASFRPGLVAFVCGGPSVSPGSWRSVVAAVRSGVPVVVFPVSSSSGAVGLWAGCSSLPALRGCGVGRWVPAASSGLWAAAFRWEPLGGGGPSAPVRLSRAASARVAELSSSLLSLGSLAVPRRGRRG